jgi:trehalose monomycolate/heme transporter
MTKTANNASATPRPMFEAWGHLLYHRRRLVLIIAGLAVVFAGVWGTGVFAHLQTAGGYTAPHSQSQREESLVTQAFGRNGGDVAVLYSSKTLTTASPAFKSAVTATLAKVPHDRVESVATYWSTGSSQFVSASGHQTYAVIELTGAGDTGRIASYDAIKDSLSAPGLTTQVGGVIPTESAINTQVSSNIGRAEGLSLPILLILLLIIFGSLAAASLPLAIGIVGILGSFTALRLLTEVTSVSNYSVNITTILGLGLGIDYGLFMVTRYREELHRQATVEDAVARTIATAGRTVVVSGITVAVALGALMLFPETFLRSMGYGGVATVLVDMIAALTIMPALLAVLGPNVNALRIRRSVQRAPVAEQEGGFYRLATRVMRRPAVYAVVIVVALLALAAPLLHVSWGGVDATALPAGSAPRTVTEALNHDFPGNPTAPIEAVVSFPGPIAGSPARTAELTTYVTRLGSVPGVSHAQQTGIHGNDARIDLSYDAGLNSPAARSLVAQVRDVSPPAGATSYVGGQTADLVDELSSLGHTLPWMALVVLLATFVMLFLAFGSVVLPVKAIIMNLLSLSAMYGAIVLIFQDGHLSRLLHFTSNGTISPTTPILMFAIMFGLSMDYEVFLLSRIRERYDVTGDNTAAIASGLQRTGGVITSAALLLLIVVGAFSASGVTFIKLLGVGMIIALIIDATIVRILLVPATMRLLGDKNWWAPKPLRVLYARYGIHEESESALADVDLTPAAAEPLPV